MTMMIMVVVVAAFAAASGGVNLVSDLQPPDFSRHEQDEANGDLLQAATRAVVRDAHVHCRA